MTERGECGIVDDIVTVADLGPEEIRTRADAAPKSTDGNGK
jgi:hypothetical protein